MDAAKLNQVIAQYAALNPGGGIIAEIEQLLGVSLPADLKRISEVFSSGKIGEFGHYSIASEGASSVVVNTLDSRKKFGLANDFVCLGGSKRQFVVLDLSKSPIVIAVPWYAKESLAHRQLDQLDAGQMVVHLGYGEFFCSLVNGVATEERRKAIRLGDSVKTSLIQSTPGVLGGGCGRVRDTRIAVSVLVELRRQGRSDKQLLVDFPELSKSDLAAAWEYYRRHTDEIDRTIEAEVGEE